MVSMEQKTILILSGWGDSDPAHWQSLWLAKYPNAVKVEQKDWDEPKKDDWVQGLDACITKHAEHPIVLVGHSLACATFAFWSRDYTEQSSATIARALMVCPSDMDQDDLPKEIQGFSPMPLEKLRFKTIVVTSENDQYVSIGRAKFFADSWGARLVNIGAHGHINVDAGFGNWPQGEELLGELLGST